jgi:hypothetical protein
MDVVTLEPQFSRITTLIAILLEYTSGMQSIMNSTWRKSKNCVRIKIVLRDMAAYIMDRILSREAKIFSASDEMLRILWNSNVDRLLQKPPLVCTLRKINQFYSLHPSVKIFNYYPYIYALTKQVTSFLQVLLPNSFSCSAYLILLYSTIPIMSVEMRKP